ncbi:hypothetical protein [Vampirovibrio sp.]|uniref:hypothetical protein n=1 Tax=Vampirovibrio sp. TaxID=2717857 RepID=UPI0035947E79
MNHFLKGALLAAVVAVSMVPANVFADENPYATFRIRLEPNPASSDYQPAVNEPITKKQVAFQIVNNTGKSLFFNSREGEYIPLVSQSTVTLPYQPGEEYKVVDTDGNTFAQWNLNRSQSEATSVSSASKEQFTAWGNTLQQVIDNQKVAVQEPPAKSEPNYYQSHSSTTSHSSSGTVVRGYW